MHMRYFRSQMAVNDSAIQRDVSHQSSFTFRICASISRKKFSPQTIILKSISLKYTCDHNISFTQLILYIAYHFFIKAAKHVSHN